MALTKVFKSGNSQAVRIPKEFQLDVDEVEILQRGNELIIRKPGQSAAALFDLLTQLSDDFFEEGRVQPPFEKRRKL
jgi:antitoxin VapB